jgi:hypothetical protein
MSPRTRTVPPPLPGEPIPAPQRTADAADPARALRTASLVAGIGLALLTVLAVFGNFVVLQRLITPGDATTTTTDIANSAALFRWGVASLLAVAALDVVVAAALLRLFTPVNPDVSRLAAWFRLAYAGVFVVAVSQLAGIRPQLDTPDQVQRSIDSFDDIWHAGLILFGVHLLLIGYLAHRSGFVARVIAVLLLIAGIGYLVDGFGTVVVAGYSLEVARVTFVGEAVLIFWLLIRGRSLTVRGDGTITSRPSRAPRS